MGSAESGGSSQRDKEIKHLKILTIDGGGMQGLSSLMILNELGDAIAANPGNKLGRPRPCDIFDVICGIGTGGWLALLLGRFHLDIPTAMRVYFQIVDSISPATTGQRWRLKWRNANYDQAQLIAEIDEIVESYQVGKTMLPEFNDGSRCQLAFAAAAEKGSVDEKKKYWIFRTYKTTKANGGLPGPDPSTCKISQAFASTCATKYLFEPYELAGTKFSDSGFPYPHNITALAVDEIRSHLGLHVPISVVINIGPGVPTKTDVNKLAGIARIFSFGSPAEHHGYPIHEAKAIARRHTENAEMRKKELGASLTPPSGLATAELHKKKWRPLTQPLKAALREEQIENEIRDQLQRQYPSTAGTAAEDKFLYFRIGPNIAPKKTAVNDVTAAKTTYKETKRYLDRVKPRLDNLAARCVRDTPRYAVAIA